MELHSSLFFFFLKKGSLTALMVYDLYVTVFCFFVHRVEFTALARDYKAVNLGQVINYKYRF